MKISITILIMFLGLQGLYAQDSNITFGCHINYLPSSNCRYEFYLQNGETVKHRYEKESKNCFELRFKKGRKINSIDLNEVSDFIRNINNRDTLIISIPKNIKDSLPSDLLQSSSYLNNDSLTIIFEQFENEYYKPDTTEFGLLPRIEGIQIDGSWLSVNFVQNQDTLFSVHKSYSGSPRVSDFKDWLTFYLVYHKYNLFQKLKINPYISEEDLTHMIRLYLERMKN